MRYRVLQRWMAPKLTLSAVKTIALSPLSPRATVGLRRACGSWRPHGHFQEKMKEPQSAGVPLKLGL